MCDGILAAHADAVVVDGEGVGVGIEADADAQVAVVFEQGRLGQRFKAQFVGGIGGVGDELAKEDFLVGVQRVDHQLQQLFDFGLEAQGLFWVCSVTVTMLLGRCRARRGGWLKG